MNTYLGIDYGRVHIGLATAEHILATPLPGLKQSPALLRELQSLCLQHKITHIILGLPTGPLLPEITRFADVLRRELKLPVIMHDETLSSQDAQRQLVEAGAKRHKKQNEHSYAAALILEDYLESHS